MKTYWIGPVRGSRCKHSCKPAVSVRPRMNLQYIAMGLVQVRNNDDVVARLKTVKSLSYDRSQNEPGIRSSFRSLFGSLAPLLQCRSHPADREKLDLSAILATQWSG